MCGEKQALNVKIAVAFRPLYEFAARQDAEDMPLDDVLEELSPEEVEELIHEADIDGDGNIFYDEFIAMIFKVPQQNSENKTSRFFKYFISYILEFQCPARKTSEQNQEIHDRGICQPVRLGLITHFTPVRPHLQSHPVHKVHQISCILLQIFFLRKVHVNVEELREVPEHGAVEGAGGGAVEEGVVPEQGGERGQVAAAQLRGGGGLQPPEHAEATLHTHPHGHQPPARAAAAVWARAFYLLTTSS